MLIFSSLQIKVCGCTEATLKNSYRTIHENRDKLFVECKSLKDYNSDFLPQP